MDERVESSKNRKLSKKNKTMILIVVIVLGIIIVFGVKFFIDSDFFIIRNIEQSGNSAFINMELDSDKFDILMKNGIRYLFVDIGGINDNGRILLEENDSRKFLNFVSEFEEKKGYNFILIPYSEIDSNYNINLRYFQDNFIQDYLYLYILGFDGILVNINSVKLENRNSYLYFIKRIYEEFPMIATVAISTGDINYGNNEFKWNKEFYKKVSEYSDLLLTKLFDSEINNQPDYKEFVKEQMREISSINLKVPVLLIVPTQKHFPETIENALNAYKEGLKENSNRLIQGVVVFYEFTDYDEWRIFKEKLFEED